MYNNNVLVQHFFTLYFYFLVLITCSIRNDSSIHNVYNISTKIEIASHFRWGCDVTNVKTGNEEKEPRGSDGGGWKGDGRGGGGGQGIYLLTEH